MINLIIGLAGTIVMLLFYFLPTIIACIGEKKNTTAIFTFNLFLGFTGLGWVIALVWSFMNE